MTLAASLLGFVFLFGFEVQKPISPCFKYEIEATTLFGAIKRVVFPGPPNYESIARGDRPEASWVLKLETSICVDQDEENDAEAKVSELQLVFDKQGSYQRYNSLLGRKVKVTGKLFHAITGHHHTPVLIQVSEIRKRQTKTVAEK